MLINALNVELNVEKFGRGTPIIILHGWGVDSEIMKGFLEPIFLKNNPGWERYYIDTPGHGKSEFPEDANSSDDMLDIVIGGIKQLVGDRSFLLAGLSYGGYLARGITYKMREQVQGLFLICPVIKAFDRELPIHTVLVRSNNSEYPQGFRNIAVVQNDRIWERYKSEVLPGVNLFDTRLKDSDLIKVNQAFSFEEDMMKSYFEKPTLIINGRQDSLVGYRDALSILESIPHATYAILDHAGHLVEIEQEKIVTPLVVEWLERVEIHNGK